MQVEILKTQLANEQVARDLVTQQFRMAVNEKRKLQKQVSIQEKNIVNLKSDIDEQKFQLISAFEEKGRMSHDHKVDSTQARTKKHDISNYMCNSVLLDLHRFTKLQVMAVMNFH